MPNSDPWDRCFYKIKVFVCLFVLRFNLQVNNFSVMSGRSHRFLLLSGSKVSSSNTQHGEVGFEPRDLAPESDAPPLSHRAPL